MKDFWNNTLSKLEQFPYSTLLMIFGLVLLALSSLAFLLSRASYFGALSPALVGSLLVAIGVTLDSDYPNPQTSTWLLIVAIIGFFFTFSGLNELLQAISGKFIIHPFATGINAFTNIACIGTILLALTRFVQDVQNRGHEKYGDALDHH